jgi:hypothetical protein
MGEKITFLIVNASLLSFAAIKKAAENRSETEFADCLLRYASSSVLAFVFGVDGGPFFFGGTTRMFLMPSIRFIHVLSSAKVHNPAE